MTRPSPTRAFTDRIYSVCRCDLEMVDAANGEWRYRVGVWYGPYLPGEPEGGTAMVKIVDWPAIGRQTPATIMTLMWGRQFQRRWPHSFTDRKLAQLAREFCEDAQRGAVGAQ